MPRPSFSFALFVTYSLFFFSIHFQLHSWNVPFAQLRSVVEWGQKKLKFYGILYDSFEKLHCDTKGTNWSKEVLYNVFEEVRVLQCTRSR